MDLLRSPATAPTRAGQPGRSVGTLGPAAVVLACAATSGCASPVEGLWPPRPGDATHRIVVSADAWHSVIGLADDPGAVEEWGYAEKRYYLGGDDGVCGTLRALLVPSAGVVQVTRSARPWAERTRQPPGRTWAFDLTDEGWARLVAALRADVADPEPVSHTGGSAWFDSVSSYHAFHHCHHWTAAALREAGLPVWTSYALFRWSFAAELDRAERMATEATETGP